VLKPAILSFTPSVESLLKIWAGRYKPDFSPLVSLPDPYDACVSLLSTASSKGRAITAAKLGGFLIDIRCQMAGIQANELYTYIPEMVKLSEAQQLYHDALLIYKKLIEIYQQQSHFTPLLTETATISEIASHAGDLSTLGLPAIEEMALALEPLLLDFQEQHLALSDWRTIGFVTTLFNFSNKLITSKLTVFEQVLLKPYFDFVEEQVALPWQQVCASAASHRLTSPVFLLVEEMLPKASEVASSVYSQLVKLLPDHRSRRGGLNDPGITHSCLRDLQMFQAYLWLCFLEGSLAPIEQELVDFCVMVMTGIRVEWKMTELWNEVLVAEIHSRISPDQQLLLQPYTDGLQQAFLSQRDLFQLEAENCLYLPPEKKQRFQTRGRKSLLFPRQLADAEA
jgi:hypothetical protein